MTQEQFLKNLTPPAGRVDVVLDTDTYNEIDDQFALCYMLRHQENFRIQGICAAPFLNARSASPEDGMEKSYNEIFKALKLADCEDLNSRVYAGSRTYLPDEKTAVSSPAAEFMAALADGYSPENPLYIVAIGAITNVASAFLKNPRMRENCVVVWLGGHAAHVHEPVWEFNMKQDVAAARVIFQSGVPLIQLPCDGVVDHFDTTRYELAHWLSGKNAMCDYLVDAVIEEAESYAAGRPWNRPIWDVTAVAWLLNENGQFMQGEVRPRFMPCYDRTYAPTEGLPPMYYVTRIHRTNLFEDLFRRLADDT